MTSGPWTSAPARSATRVDGAERPLVGDVDLRTRRRADASVLLAGAVAAVAFDVAARRGPATIAAAGAVAVVAAALASTKRFATPHALGALGVAALVGAFLAARTSPWVVGPDLVAVVGLFGLAGTLAAGGSVTDLSIPRATARIGVTAIHVFLAPGYAAGAFADRRRPEWAPVLRGAAIAAPIVLLIGGLLASADAVFAELVRVPAGIDDLLAHGMLLVMGAWLTFGLLRTADAAQPEPFPGRLPALGPTEAHFVVGGPAVLFSAFLAAQVAATTSFGDRVLREGGLTYAEHARRGFFQLLAVATITLAVLLAVDACADRRASVTGLGLLTIGLTVGLVWVAVHRLAAYEEAYGLTMLRLASTVFALGIGGVFVLLAVRILGAARDRHWFLCAAGSLALVVLVVWNGLAPDAVVARRNLDRAVAGRSFDPVHIAGLSDDAVPALVSGLDRLDPASRAALMAQLCARPSRDVAPGLSWNRSRARAAGVLGRLCRVPS